MRQVTDIDINKLYEVKVEKLSNLGYGIAKIDGFVVFIPNSCPDDELKIKITKKNKNFGHAEIVEIIKPSESRIEPFCKMQKVCGACQLQFINYELQLKYKKEIVEDCMHSLSLKDIQINDVIPSPEIKEFRHKIQYPISETKESKRMLAGYYKSGSHEIVNIKHCPIQPSYCDKIIEFIRENSKQYNVSGYIESKHSGDLRHVVIRSSAFNNKSLVILVVNSDKIKDKFTKLAECIYNNLPNISGVGINFNNKKTNLILGNRTDFVIGDKYIYETLCDKTFKVSANTFFQVNPKSANNIFIYIRDYISKNFNNPSILDAYAGIAAFGICMSDTASKVVSVEEVKESVDLANEIINDNNINNIKTICMDAGKCFSEMANSDEKFDITILDPPRKGCTKESLEYALKLTTKKIIYVSCNPSSLARDLKFLTEKGCKIKSIQPFDMFPHTYHIENVVIIDR